MDPKTHNEELLQQLAYAKELLANEHTTLAYTKVVHLDEVTGDPDWQHPDFQDEDQPYDNAPEMLTGEKEAVFVPVNPKSCHHYTASQENFDTFPVVAPSTEYAFDRPNDYPSCSDVQLNKKGQFACSYMIGDQHECGRYQEDVAVTIEHRRSEKSEYKLISQRHNIGVPILVITRSEENDYGMLTVPVATFDPTVVADVESSAAGYLAGCCAGDGATQVVEQNVPIPVSYLAKLVS